VWKALQDCQYSERGTLGEKSRVKQEEKQKYNVPLGGTIGYQDQLTRMAISESWLPSNNIKSWLVQALHYTCISEVKVY
jgi:hypothetical protein